VGTSSSHSIESPLPREPLRARIGRAWRKRKKAKPVEPRPATVVDGLDAAPVVRLAPKRERAAVYDRKALLSMLERDLAAGDSFEVETDEITAEHLRDALDD
jgi:hypothetical protein